jgi:hypothetical protein
LEQNKQESDPFDQVLALQGIGWILRKAIGVMPVTLVIKEYTDDKGADHIDIEQPGAAGIKGTTERRIITDEWQEHEDHIFGRVRGRSKWSKISELTDDDKADEAHLKSKWDKATQDGDILDNHVESQGNGWVGRLVWGFQEVNGKRKYARNVVVKKGDKVERVTLIYDYKPSS